MADEPAAPLAAVARSDGGADGSPESAAEVEALRGELGKMRMQLFSAHSQLRKAEEELEEAREGGMGAAGTPRPEAGGGGEMFMILLCYTIHIFLLYLIIYFGGKDIISRVSDIYCQFSVDFRVTYYFL